MTFYNYVLKIRDGAVHLVSGGLGIHSLYNLYQGIAQGSSEHIQLGIMEGVLAAFFETKLLASKAQRRYWIERYGEDINTFEKWVKNIAVPEVNRLREIIGNNFEKLSDRLNKAPTHQLDVVASPETKISHTSLEDMLSLTIDYNKKRLDPTYSVK